MLTPVFIHRMKDQRLIGAVLSLLILLGYMRAADSTPPMRWAG